MRVLFFLAAAILSPLLCFADVAPATTAPASAPSVIFLLFRLVGALAIVFALFLGGAHLFKNWQRLTLKKGSAPKLKILEVRSLAPRQALYVVAYEERRLLIGSSPAGLALLSPLPEALEDEETLPPAPPLNNFAEVLMKAVSLR
jgi:flagellar biogenesis protein FliO